MIEVEEVNESQASSLTPSLVRLLQNVVHDGASIGFLAPLSAEDAERYWQKVRHDLREQTRVLLVVRGGTEVVGTVQLGLVMTQNGPHRAEVQKLFVHTEFRRRGIAQSLLAAVEDAARAQGRTLLVLDTREGDAAALLYSRLGYTRAGIIPQYVINSDGVYEGTQIFYRLLT